MDIGRIKDLHQKFLAGKLTVSEGLEWQQLLKDPNEEEQLLSIADGLWKHTPEALLEDMPEAISNEIFALVVADGKSSGRTRKLWLRMAGVAAAILLLFGLGLVYQYHFIQSVDGLLLAERDIAPGVNGATLTLADGRRILINDALAGDIASQTGVRISKTADGQLIYEVTGKDTGILTYNTLSTTRGQQSQVRLPDGTLVFLNAESSLRYPTTFNGSAKRMVSLQGEAFFEVARDSAHPFIVNTAHQKVEVLGTRFNINSYQAATTTTLIEGSVRVSAGTYSKLLKPDQQATTTVMGISIREVEAQFSIDWKEGFFMFDNETLESIAGRVARWYDIRVEFGDVSLKQKRLSGTVSKYGHISSVIKVLDQGNFAHFRLDKGTLRIDKR